MAEIKLNKRYKYAGDIFRKLIGIGFDVETATAFLSEVEDADVAEVKHGHWIKSGNEKKCSVCGFVYYSNNDEWNGCPNCLARMYERRDT